MCYNTCTLFAALQLLGYGILTFSVLVKLPQVGCITLLTLCCQSGLPDHWCVH
jgi:hypothetical protein